jgi:hypothetical protein
MNLGKPDKRVFGLLAVTAAICVGLMLALARSVARPSSAPVSAAAQPIHEADAVPEQVATFCGACHVEPPADSFPRDSWKDEVAQGYRFFEASELSLRAPSREAVVRYYEDRAPSALPLPEKPVSAGPPALVLQRQGYPHPLAPPSPPAVANVRFVHLFDERRLDVLVCEMRLGQLLVLQPYEPKASLRLLSDMFDSPAHVEVVDLDRDGRKDLLVADLGSFVPTDEKRGKVVWLRGTADGTFTPVPLAWDLGRVADVQAADFDGDGDLDLIVAVFGMHTSGEILYLENRTTDYAQPRFVTTRIDPRHGTIHVPVADLNGDGRPDFVALISQEHETVVAFINEGGGRFGRKPIYTAPHPAFGSSGIALVDLDGDGDLDVLYTNGDVLDGKDILRPDHGVHWLENRGTYPFRPHRLATLCGASRAEAADLDGDGDLDVVATSFLPGEFYRPLRSQLRLDSMILLEQTGPGKFVRHPLETAANDHASVDLGDFDGNGTVDLVIGNFTSVAFDLGKEPRQSGPAGDWLVIASNPKGRPTTPPQTRARPAAAPADATK